MTDNDEHVQRPRENYVNYGMDIFSVVIYLVIYVNIGYILVICD